MAEVLGLASSIAGLINLADLVVGRVVKYVREAKHAKEEIAKFLTELSGLNGILRSLLVLAKQYEKESVDSGIKIHHIQSCFETLDKIQCELSKADPARQHRPFDSLQRKLRWPFSRSDAIRYIEDLERHKSTLTLGLASDSLATLLRALSRQDDISTDLKDVKKEMKRRNDREDRYIHDRARIKIYDFLGTINPRTNQDAALRLLQPGTGLWFTEGEEFRSWLRTPHSRLWIYGIPGAGKTILMSMIIQQLLDSSNEDTGVAYFYCDYKDSSTHQITTILGSLAKQLAMQDDGAYEKVKLFYQTHNPEGILSRTPSTDDLVNLVVDTMTSFETAAIVVDGLDECGSSMSEVTKILADLHVLATTDTKLLLASRDEHAIRTKLGDHVGVSIAARSDDLKCYVLAEMQLRIDQNRLKIRQPALKEHILTRLVEKADGMFRWVTCQMDYLCQLRSDRQRREALESLPPDLPQSYERILERVNMSGKENVELVQRALRWVIFAKIPLSLPALAEALSVEVGSDILNIDDFTDEEGILESCSSLIRVSGTARTVELAHFTVKEYLLSLTSSTKPELQQYKLDEEEAQQYLATVCLTHCCLENFAHVDLKDDDQLQLELAGNAFRAYAAVWWADHARGKLHDSGIFTLAKRLFRQEKSRIFVSWAAQYVRNSQLCEYYEENEQPFSACTSDTSTLHWACFLSLPRLCQWLLDEGSDANRPSKLGLPLQSSLGQSMSLTWIVPHGIGNSDIDGELWSLQVIDILIRGGADVNRKGNFSLTRGGDGGYGEASPLSLALISHGHAICHALLKAGAVLSPHDLEDLRENGDAESIQGVICKRNLRFEDQIDFIELVLESRDVQPSVKDLLQQMKPPAKAPKASNTDYALSLCKAAEYGQYEIVTTFLTDFGVEPNSSVEGGMTALHFAAREAHVQVVEILLDSGANISSANTSGETALHLATGVGSIPCLNTLLARGGKVDQPDAAGLTPFHIAALSSDLAVLKLFTKRRDGHGMSQIMETEDGRTLLLCAAEGGSLETVKFVTTSFPNLDVFAKTNNGFDCLHVAARSGSVEVVQYFISLGLFPTSITNDLSTALHCAVKYPFCKENLAVLKNLLANGANANAVDESGASTLHLLCELAMNSQLAEAIETMLQYGASVALEDDTGKTAFHDLLESLPHINGYEDEDFLLSTEKAIMLFLKFGSSMIAEDGDGTSPLLGIVRHWEYLDNEHDSAKKEFLTKVTGNLIDHLEVDSVEHKRKPDMASLLNTFLSHSEILAEKILRLRPDVNDHVSNDAGFTPLQRACIVGCSVGLLNRIISLSDGSHHQIKCYGLNLLHLASVHGRGGLVTELLRHGFGLEDRVASTQETAFLFAVRHGHAETAKILLENGADIAAKDISGKDAAHLTCEEGHSDVLRLLISHDLPIDRPVRVCLNLRSGDATKVEATCLHLASLSQHCHIIEDLLSTSANSFDVNHGTTDNTTPLMIAAANGSVQMTSLLLSYGAQTDIAETRFGFTALHYAVGFGNEAVVNLLLSAGAKVEQIDLRGYSPALYALERHHEVVYKILQTHEFSAVAPIGPLTGLTGPLCNELSPSSTMLSKQLALAIRNGDGVLCCRLLEQGANPHHPLFTDVTPLIYALVEKQPTIARILLDHGATSEGHCSVGQWHGTGPLHFAASQGPCDLLRTMLDRISDYRDVTPLHPIHIAAARGCLECLNTLLDHDMRWRDHRTTCNSSEVLRMSPEKPSVNFMKPDSALAAGMINIQIALKDMQWTGELNQFTFTNNLFFSGTVLHIASYLGNTKVVSLLLRRGANLEETNDEGRTSLHVSAREGMIEVTRILLQAGANPNSRDLKGQTPMMLAAKQSSLPTLNMLLGYGADPTAFDISGWSAIHFAGSYPQYDVLSFFMTIGQRITLPCLGSLETPLALALYSADDITEAWLLDYVTSINQCCISSHEPRYGNSLTYLARGNRVDAIKRLLRQSSEEGLRAIIDISSCTEPPVLWAAAFFGREQIVQELLDAGADIEIQWNRIGTALMAASAMGRLSVVQLLVSRGAKLTYLDNEGNPISALYHALQHPRVLKWLKATESGSRDVPLPCESVQPRLPAAQYADYMIAERGIRRRNSFSFNYSSWEAVESLDLHKEFKPAWQSTCFEPSLDTGKELLRPLWAQSHQFKTRISRDALGKPWIFS